MLSEKELNGFLNGCETRRQSGIMGDVYNETSTDDNWNNLWYSRSNSTVCNYEGQIGAL